MSNPTYRGIPTGLTYGCTAMPVRIPSILARQGSTCPICKQRISIGDRIIKPLAAHRWQHEHCPAPRPSLAEMAAAMEPAAEAESRMAERAANSDEPEPAEAAAIAEAAALEGVPAARLRPDEEGLPIEIATKLLELRQELVRAYHYESACERAASEASQRAFALRWQGTHHERWERKHADELAEAKLEVARSRYRRLGSAVKMMRAASGLA